MIKVEGLRKSFRGQQVLRGVDLEVPTGSLTALLGPSGSGKSTLLRVIAGLERPDEGEVLIAEEDVTGHAPQRRGVGFVFQHYAAFKHMTVYENVAFGLRVQRRPRAEIRQRVHELLLDDGRQVTAQLSRDEAEQLEVDRGQIVYVKAARSKAFS